MIIADKLYLDEIIGIYLYNEKTKKMLKHHLYSSCKSGNKCLFTVHYWA